METMLLENNHNERLQKNEYLQNSGNENEIEVLEFLIYALHFINENNNLAENNPTY